MIEVGLGTWTAWVGDDVPDVSFLPPLLRRRCTRLTRMMLHVAHRAAAERIAALPTVFASRHGDMGATLALLQTLARREPLTAAAFSHSVHNTQAGLFSIAATNRHMASAVAAGADTFGAAFLEGVAAMQRGGHDRVLLVIGDEALPHAFARFEEQSGPAYAVAVLLGPDGVRLGFEPGVEAPPRRAGRPDALEFVTWLEDAHATPALTLGSRTAYRWTRL